MERGDICPYCMDADCPSTMNVCPGREVGGPWLIDQANAALAAAIHVLMRPVTIEVDAEVFDARMACMCAQDAIARRGKEGT